MLFSVTALFGLATIASTAALPLDKRAVTDADILQFALTVCSPLQKLVIKY
jgi:hypothetical protein